MRSGVCQVTLEQQVTENGWGIENFLHGQGVRCNHKTQFPKNIHHPNSSILQTDEEQSIKLAKHSTIGFRMQICSF